MRVEGIHLEKEPQDGSVMVIDQLAMHHSNSYTCVVNNNLTTHEASFLLKVRGMCVLCSRLPR